LGGRESRGRDRYRENESNRRRLVRMPLASAAERRSVYKGKKEEEGSWENRLGGSPSGLQRIAHIITLTVEGK